MDDLLANSAGELFTRACPPEVARAIRHGGSAAALWDAIEESGFLDALVPEAAGGAGLRPIDTLPVLLAAGRFAAPVPVGETMLVRAAFAAARQAAPEGPVALAQPVAADAAWRARAAWARQSRRVLVPRGEAALLLPRPALPGTDYVNDTAATMTWEQPEPEAALEGGTDWLVAGAWAELCRMAGAMDRILEDTIRYAGERVQFGRPIAGFQAVQQQLSVLTEEVFAGRMAAQLASLPSAGEASLDPLRVAAGKARIGEAAIRVAAIAHGVLGAMGITEEVPLHLMTEQLHRGRLAFGSEAYWHGVLGRACLDGPAVTSLGFVQERLAPAEA
ncbi:acyl-CoA dehydrogenase family protein [Roseomonas sp. NAR14]|uniref:Acyl-CoA dehydrogenase family protein n=1 Tax=Roseomonas acroporae TaxID=2937791 RepID=A0A9X1YAF9_9PROT|nr:acyl-CoA dehydrogenase family protein [Roseomonas acroporae]MCK8785345.1 acyl-CoA dehydrogenase family protein [Roseomonas acroporae]